MLTNKQQKLLSYIKSCSADGGKTAKVSYQAMADYLGTPSLSGIANVVLMLIAKRYLDRTSPESPREGIVYTILKVK